VKQDDEDHSDNKAKAASCDAQGQLDFANDLIIGVEKRRSVSGGCINAG